jgi:lipoate-protein ligase A
MDTLAIRLLNDPPLRGPINMARDEAMMTLVGTGESPPAFRLYQWVEPTVSLGYFQRHADFLAMPPRVSELAVVRRPTGGGAILHDLELTYSIALPMGHPLLKQGPNRLYEVVHDALITALREHDVMSARCAHSDGSGAARGPFFCFSRRHCYDLLVGPEKIVGSAQRRTRHAVLQHGSIILANRFREQPTAAVTQPFEQTVRALRASFPCVLQANLATILAPGSWSDHELAVAAELLPKYAGDAWTRRL